MTNNYESFRTRLEECHEWPCVYTFKFIIPQDRLAELYAVIPEEHASLRPSRTGKFVSMTASIHIEGSDEIIDIYEKVSRIEGAISL